MFCLAVYALSYRYRLFGKKHYIQTLSFSMNSKLSANKFNNVLFMYIYCQIRLFSLGGVGVGATCWTQLILSNQLKC